MTSKYQLKNGMSVLLIESRKSPVVAVQMWVKTGSADEKRGQEGISHFIEHLVFKGTQKYNVGEIAGAVESAGGDMNAYTSFDQTVFHVTISKAYVDTGLEVISEMMGRPRFDEAEINNEREVVIEEIKRSKDNPHQQGSRLLFSTTYKQHPYGLPVLGYDDNIRRVSREEIQGYFQSRYVPKNMNLVIVGDFESTEMKKKVQKYFGTFKDYKLKKVVRKSEPKQGKARLAVGNAPFAESFLYLSWPVPKAMHKDSVVLSLLGIILGQGESSRLVRAIRNEQHLVNSISASAFSPKEPGFFCISSTLNPDKILQVLNSVQKEVESFLKTGPTEDELAKAVRIFESEQYYSMETVDGLAGLWGHFEFLYNDYKYFNKHLKQVKGVKPQDILEAARKYMTNENLCVAHLSKANAEQTQKTIEAWLKQFRPGKIKPEKKSQRGAKVAKSKAPLWKAPKRETVHTPEYWTLPSGARVVVKKINGSPVVSARIGFLSGLRWEDPRRVGVGELTSRTWSSGTKTLSEYELNKKIENMASAIATFGGKNSLGLAMTALSHYAGETFRLVEEILLTPRLDEKILEREKQLMSEYIKNRGDKPAQVCMLNMAKTLFGDHPYGRDPYGGEKAVPGLSGEDVKKYLSHAIYGKNMVISLVGDIAPEKWKSIFTQLSQKISSNGQTPKLAAAKALTKNEVIFTSSEKAQTHLAVAYRGLSFLDPDRYALEILQAVLSGMGGRLFVELRDKASLAYTVAPLRMDGIEPGYFGAYIGCSPDKANKAYEMIQKELSKLVKTPVPQEELSRAQRYLLGRHDISLQRTGSVADQLLFNELYGLPHEELENYHDNLSRVTPAQVQSLARRLFSQPFVVSVVGPKNVSI